MTISDAEIALQRRAARLVVREVHACMSSLVATLAKAGGGAIHNGRGTNPYCDDAISGTMALADQALELAAPVLDYEGALREVGWTQTPQGWWWREPDADEVEDGSADFYFLGSGPFLRFDDAYAACENDDVQPLENEVFEHWAVSTWLAEKLIEQGERVDADFSGLNVWARTTTGQAISADSVIEAITAETGYASVPGPDMLDGEA